MVENEKTMYSEEEVDWYIICKICAIGKTIYFDIMLSMMKDHQPLLKLLNIFKK